MPNETLHQEENVAPNIEDNLAFLQQRLDRLEAEVGSSAGVNQYPEWWDEDFGRMREVVPQLKDAETDPDNISKYYDIFCRDAELRTVITGSRANTHPIQQLEYSLGADVLGRAFRAEPSNGSLHMAMIEDLRVNTQKSGDSIAPELNILREAYGCQSLTGLFAVGGDDYTNNLRSLLHTDKAVRSIRFKEEERGDDFKIADRQEAARTWMSEAVVASTSIDTQEASDFVFSASRGGSDEDIVSVLDKFDHFGVDRIRAIAKFTGIHGLEAYSVEQLERMEELASNPVKVAERLRDHDVTVVYTNRFGDHNGVLRDTAAVYDDETGRTLFFEISSMGDIYRHTITLKKCGIQPASVVLAAHSDPGEFVVSDLREKNARRSDFATLAGRKLVQMTNAGAELGSGDWDYSMHGMKGMANLVENYMQPSRAIDDDESDVGRKKIIFQACHAAAEVEMNDLDDNNEQIQTSMESVISQLGKDLIASGVQTNVDIYGAPGGIQMRRTNHGVRYTGQAAIFSDDRIPMHAERIRIERGHLSEQEVDEVTLRKAA